MKGSIDWLDVSIHVGVAAALVATAGLFGFQWIAAPLNAGFWYSWERFDKDRGWLPWTWGIGSQAEFYAPALVGALVATVFSVI